MKNNKLLKTILILSIIILIIGCGSNEVIKEEPVIEKKAVETEKPVEEVKEITKPKPIEKIEPVEEVKIVPQPSPELPDSVMVMYMTKQDDWLSKIAISEYGEVTMWRSIWKWNYEEIGDNPNIIYPYKEFDLKKPRETAKDIEYELVDYTVKQGDTLWSISKNKYGNNYAWIVILRDNFDTIGDNQDSIDPGTVLKLRTNLF